MKRNFLIALMTVALFATSVTAAQTGGVAQKFSGTWKLDAAKSEGLPPGMQQVMTVTLSDDKLSLQTKVITEEGEQVVDDSYVVNGQMVDFAPRAGNGLTGKGKRTAKWTADGAGLEVSEEAEFETPDGAAKIQMKRKWLLAADGKTLTIELNFTGPQGSNSSRRTFVKQA